MLLSLFTIVFLPGQEIKGCYQTLLSFKTLAQLQVPEILYSNVLFWKCLVKMKRHPCKETELPWDKWGSVPWANKSKGILVLAAECTVLDSVVDAILP